MTPKLNNSRRNYALSGALFVLVTVLAAVVSACIPVEWSTNAQGQIDSVGLPGLPVWQSQKLRQQNALARSGMLAAQPGTTVDPAAANIAAYASEADWLAEINRWRAATGTNPVGQN